MMNAPNLPSIVGASCELGEVDTWLDDLCAEALVTAESLWYSEEPENASSEHCTTTEMPSSVETDLSVTKRDLQLECR